VDHGWKRGERRVAAAAVDSERTAEELGRSTAAAAAQPQLGVHGVRGEQVLEPERGAPGLVAQPVRVAARKDQEIARVQLPRLVVDLEPAFSPGDDVEGGESARLDAEAPRGSERGAAVERARHAQVAEEGVDGVRLVGAREPIRHDRARLRPPRAADHSSCGGTSSPTTYRK
jgi:hypothetical protein